MCNKHGVLKGYCRLCVVERVKKWRVEHHDEFLEQRRKWRESHPGVAAKAQRKWYKTHSEASTLSNKRWRKENADRFREHNRIYVLNRTRTDIGYKLAHNLRDRLRTAVKREYKVGSAVRDLGCTVEYLKQHIESQFESGMSWDNYGQFGWHIDHIKPLDSFDLTNRSQLLQACNYTNLRPLWWNENLSKGAKYVQA